MLYGVTIGANQPGQLLDKRVISAMQDLGLKALRFQVPAHNVTDSNGNVTSWQQWDSAVNACNEAGLQCFLTIKQLPPNLTHNGIPTPSGMHKLALQLASRYKSKIAGIELGNEDFNVSPIFYFAELADCCVACYDTIKTIDPSILVIPGALLQRNSQHITEAVKTLVGMASHSLDVINFHFYTGIPSDGKLNPADNTVSNVPSFNQFVQDIKTGLGSISKNIWCTEYGFAVNTNFGRAKRTVVSEQTRSMYNLYCLDQAHTLGVSAMFVFTIGYHQPTDGMSLIQNGQTTLTYTRMKQYIQQESIVVSGGTC